MARLLKGIPQEFKDIEKVKDWKEKFVSEGKALKAIEARTTIVKQQVADSYAYYEVVKRTPLQLRWIPYCDAWTASPAWIRGLRISDVEEQERWTKAVAKANEGERTYHILNY
jgi:hypothetical protein